MTHDDLGPMPEPRIDPGEPNPGGVDAIDGGDPSEPVIPNLPPEKNPSVSTAAPDELNTGEDTSTQATDDKEPMSGEQESPA